MNFWLLFAINEGVDVAEAYLAATSNLTPAQQTALQNFVASADQVVIAFGGSNNILAKKS